MEDKSWYYRNRDHVLDLAKKYREQNADKIRDYQREYYQKRRASRPPPPPKPPKETPAPLAPKLVFLPKNPPCPKTDGRKKRGMRPPKATYEYTPKEQETAGWFMKAHQRDKLLANCPQGFLAEDKKENPFLVSFF